MLFICVEQYECVCVNVKIIHSSQFQIHFSILVSDPLQHSFNLTLTLKQR